MFARFAASRVAARSNVQVFARLAGDHEIPPTGLSRMPGPLADKPKVSKALPKALPRNSVEARRTQVESAGTAVCFLLFERVDQVADGVVCFERMA